MKTVIGASVIIFMFAVASISGEPIKDKDRESSNITKSGFTRTISKRYPNFNEQEVIFYADGTKVAEKTFDKDGNVFLKGVLPDGVYKHS